VTTGSWGGQRFAGKELAKALPRSTHAASCRRVLTCSLSTRSQPCIWRPRISIGWACEEATRASDLDGSTRTNRPPWPLAATAILPPIRNASPPNIFFSLSPGSSAIMSRMRSASSSSYATRLSSRTRTSESRMDLKVVCESSLRDFQLDRVTTTNHRIWAEPCPRCSSPVHDGPRHHRRGGGWTRTSDQRIMSSLQRGSPTCVFGAFSLLRCRFRVSSSTSEYQRFSPRMVTKW
jgi:hypothetical protein